jgi:hypothetical protein
LQRLIKLAASDDEEVAAIACYGRPVAKRLGVRNIVMHLMNSSNDELKRHALLCVSKLLAQNWQHINS